MIYGWWYCICIRENAKKKKKEKKYRYLVHFHPRSKGQPESLVDDVPRVSKQHRVLGGRIWKICGICQHLTILSCQYSSCLIEKCVLNCRNLFFFLKNLFFCCNVKIRQKKSSNTSTGWCEETIAVQKSFWQGGPEDEHKHLRASYLTTGPERLSGAPQRNNRHISKDEEETTQCSRGF